MKYSIYKLEFQTGVHLGMGMLNESEYTFRADQLFSALYIEALKLKCEKEFYDCVKRGKLLFSDAFPYLGKNVYDTEANAICRTKGPWNIRTKEIIQENEVYFN